MMKIVFYICVLTLVHVVNVATTLCEPNSFFKIDCNACKCTDDGHYYYCTGKPCFPTKKGALAQNHIRVYEEQPQYIRNVLNNENEPSFADVDELEIGGIYPPVELNDEDDNMSNDIPVDDTFDPAFQEDDDFAFDG